MPPLRFRRIEFRSPEPLRFCDSPSFHVVVAQEELSRLYGVSSLVVTPDPVAWEREFVLIAERGECPTGGYSVRIEALDRAPSGELVVRVIETDPAPTDFVTMVITHPRDAVAVRRGGLEGLSRVSFVGPGGRILKAVEVAL